MSPDGSHRREVPPDYYDFLQEIPLIDEKAIGVGEYRRFLVNTLALEAKLDGPPKLADRYKLSGLGLSPTVHAQLDSMYDANSHPNYHRRSICRGWDCRRLPNPNSTPCTQTPKRSARPKRPFGWDWSYRRPP